jgi:hypothetical protein
MSPEVTAVAADPIIMQMGLGLFIVGGLVYAIRNARLAYKSKK